MDLYYQPKNLELLLSHAVASYATSRAREAALVYQYILTFCREKAIRILCYKNLYFLLQRGIDIAPFELIPPFLNAVPAHKFPLTMTTCKRFSLFERTMRSFVRCVDTRCLGNVYIIDDQSTSDDLRAMENVLDDLKFDHYEIIRKQPCEKGHAKSINHILALVSESPFFIHLEDDFEFFAPFPLIRTCAEILMQFPEYGQCLFNNSYSEEREKMVAPPLGAQRATESGAIFYEHIWKDATNPHGYWPGFSLRPALNRTRMFAELGPVIECGSFEKDYAVRAAAAGWKIAYLESTFCEHIGRKTSERFDASKQNAYTLNQSEQFNNFVFETRPSHSIIPNLKIKEDILNRLFLCNHEELAREQIDTALAHFKQWTELSRRFKQIQAFLISTKFDGLVHDLPLQDWCEPYYSLNGFEPWDVLFLTVGKKNSLRLTSDPERTFHEATAYLLNYTGAFKLLKWVKENGLRDGVAHALSQANLICFEGEP